MALHHESAGNSAASGNAVTTGPSSLDQARNARSAGASSIAAESMADQFSTLRATLRRIRYLSESTDAHLEQYRGTEIDRDQMQWAFATLGDQAWEALETLKALESLARDCRRQAEKLGVSHG